MTHVHHPSLEDMPISNDGTVQLPVICDRCFHAQHKERGAWSCPKSYAAIATQPYHFHVVDWMGYAVTVCRCCGSQHYGERHSVELMRKR